MTPYSLALLTCLMKTVWVEGATYQLSTISIPTQFANTRCQFWFSLSHSYDFNHLFAFYINGIGFGRHSWVIFSGLVLKLVLIFEQQLISLRQLDLPWHTDLPIFENLGISLMTNRNKNTNFMLWNNGRCFNLDNSKYRGDPVSFMILVLLVRDIVNTIHIHL